MLSTAQSPTSSSYPIEASGWDSTQSFFVERSELEWNEETGKCLALTHSLRPGASKGWGTGGCRTLESGGTRMCTSPCNVGVVPEWEEGSR